MEKLEVLDADLRQSIKEHKEKYTKLSEQLERLLLKHQQLASSRQV